LKAVKFVLKYFEKELRIIFKSILVWRTGWL